MPHRRHAVHRVSCIPARALPLWTCGYRYRTAGWTLRESFPSCGSSATSIRTQAEEMEAIPVLAGYCLRNGGERFIPLAFMLETVRQHDHADHPPLVLPLEHRAREEVGAGTRGC